MTNARTESTILSNGVKMPWLGLGVWKVKDDGEAERTVTSAIEAGYRSIDTAAAYNNEEGVGAGIRNSGITRDEIFVTTKIWNSAQGYESSLAAFEESRKKLGLDVVDLLLIHWPVKEKYKETWRALEKLYRDGYVRAIGVSNFQIHHLRDVIASGEFVPMVNQVEFHPLLTQTELLSFTKSNKIQLEAWSPLMQGNLDHSILAEIGAKYGKSPAQVVLRWDLQNGVITIPKSTNPVRIKENADIFDFSLTAEEISQISALNRDQRFGSDPDNFNF
ncbi:glyoxal reductase [Paenibacillus sp. FSL H8-0548]|uniref:aldo/keto reductase n=1 Tax=Paenibacillus sp. FSL H8-0548 TaxID=1920422 RepID=UPI00096F7F68|nr:aldo/keto reductase [Paenibacillus sp. FSL H8-0548]OMF29803.1 glyoxal reductase [Paenibacillus sp. FSL H8-0548]